jgi:hypothetical protein
MGRHKRHFLSFALAVPPTAAWRATLRRGRAVAGLSPETYNLKRSASVPVRQRTQRRVRAQGRQVGILNSKGNQARIAYYTRILCGRLFQTVFCHL